MSQDLTELGSVGMVLMVAANPLVSLSTSIIGEKGCDHSSVVRLRGSSKTKPNASLINKTKNCWSWYKKKIQRRVLRLLKEALESTSYLIVNRASENKILL